MLKAYAATLLACIGFAPTLASAQFVVERERYKLPVIQLSANTFEVVEANGAGGQHIWCGAGIYVRRGLGLADGDIEIVVPRGASQTAPGRKSVVFQINAVQADKPGYTTNNIGKAGAAKSVFAAYSVCRFSPGVRVQLADGRRIWSGF